MFLLFCFFRAQLNSRLISHHESCQTNLNPQTDIFKSNNYFLRDIEKCSIMHKQLLRCCEIENEKYVECEQNGFGIGDDHYYSRFGPNCTLHVELR